MTEIKVGSKLRDNDKRQKGRIIVVTEVEEVPLNLSYGDGLKKVVAVKYHTGKRNATIRADRIFTDGKKRQRGFNLITGA